MENNLSLSLLVSIGGIIASCASAFAIVKTKVAHVEDTAKNLENRIEEMAERQSDEKIELALLKTNQANFERAMAEIKADVKTTMTTVQEIKEAVITAKKGVA